LLNPWAYPLQYHNFLETVLSGLLEVVFLDGAKVVVSARQNSSTYWGRCLAVIECDKPRKMDMKCRAN